jgi:cyclase
MALTHASVLTSRYFQFEEVAEGIYAAIVTAAGGAIGNAGILDLGNQTLLFDTTQLPQAALDLRSAAEHLTGRPISTVINSHWHGDHVNGNMIFGPEVNILATSPTRKLMAKYGVREVKKDRETIGDYLKSLEEKVAQAEDDAGRRRWADWLSANREYAAALPTLELRLPNVTFEQRHSFYGTRRRAELLTYGGGHSQSDSFLWLPDDGVAFLADLLFVGSHPWLRGGDAEEWDRILRQIETLKIIRAVPGHGPVGTLEDAGRVRQYLADLRQIAENAAKEKLSLETTLQTPIPAAYTNWEFRSFYKITLRFLYERLTLASE